MLTAKWIFPVSREPIHRGWVRLHGGEIVEIGSGAAPSGAKDLGDVALLPGLVNAHTHLEFSDRRQPIGRPGMALHDWIGKVIAARRGTTVASKRLAIAQGVRESLAAGVRLIGEIVTPPSHYPIDSNLPSMVRFAEVLGLSPERGGERLEAAIRYNESDERAGWSPHAPYSTSLDLVDSCLLNAKASGRPLAMHVAESVAERELLAAGTGPLAETLRSLGVWQEQLFPWGDDPFGMLIDRLSEAPLAVLIHGNDLRPSEIDRLGQCPTVSVVFCPRTHAFFGFDKHPLDRMLSAGVRVALGTDSRASNPDLNLWREVQFLLRNRSDLAPQDVLRMATMNGADALGYHRLGRIEVGCDGGLGQVATTGSKIEEVYEDFLRSEYVCTGYPEFNPT